MPSRGTWIAIAAGGAVVVGIGIYLATRPTAAAASSPSHGPQTNQGPAPGAPGSRENPLQLSPSQIFGPQGAWGVRDAGGQHILGRFTEPHTIVGVTEYKFVPVSSTALPPPPPTDAELRAEAMVLAQQQAAESARQQEAIARQPTYQLTIQPENSQPSISLKIGDKLQLVADPRFGFSPTGSPVSFIPEDQGVMLQDMGGGLFQAIRAGNTGINAMISGGVPDGQRVGTVFVAVT